MLFRIFGIAGLLFIVFALVSNGKRYEYWSFALGSTLLLAYSYYLGDVIFMILQTVAGAAAVYEAITKKK